jgi:hypothetical protein
VHVQVFLRYLCQIGNIDISHQNTELISLT